MVESDVPLDPGSSVPDTAGTISTEQEISAPAELPSFLLVLPALVFLGILFVYPVVHVVVRSVVGIQGPSLEQYAKFLIDPIYLKIFGITFQVALLVTLGTLLLGYPFAYVLTSAGPRVAAFLMGCVVLPFLTSTVVRSYSWMVVLSPEGLVNRLLHLVGLGGTQLLYNRAGVVIGMTYVLLPYMVLTLYSVMRGINRDLLQAAYNLGASDWQAFRRVFLPLTFPGVAGGCILVFILSLGFFVTPRLLGGAQDQMVAMTIDLQVEHLMHWDFASALAGILLGFTIFGFILYDRVVGFQSLLQSKVP